MSVFGYLGNKGEDYLHTELIYNIAKITGCNTYLELGIYDGSNAIRIADIVPNVYCVDINNIATPKHKYTFFNMTTDDFFTINDKTFDMIYIDANHNYEYVIRDFENSYKILNEFGIILIDDTDPISEKYTDEKFCSDSYKIIDYILDKYPDELNVVTIPITEKGITIINRKRDRRVKKYIK